MDRSLFKAAANQRARAGSSTKPKYRGKSKAELLALLKAKQAAQEQEKAAPVSPSGSSKPVQPAQPAQPTQAASLPVGFFDQDENGGIQAESSPATQQMQQAWQEQGLEQEGGTISAEGTLPADFFDAPTKSAPQAPKEKRKKLTPEQQADWGEFQTFAAKVNKDEAEEEVGDEAIEMDTKLQEEREQLEQLTYMGRFAELVQHSERRKASKGGSRAVVSTLPAAAEAKLATIQQPAAASSAAAELRHVAVGEAPKDSAVGEITNLLQSRKRRRQEEEDSAFQGGYVPLEGLDWRAKSLS